MFQNTSTQYSKTILKLFKFTTLNSDLKSQVHTHTVQLGRNLENRVQCVAKEHRSSGDRTTNTTINEQPAPTTTITHKKPNYEFYSLKPSCH